MQTKGGAPAAGGIAEFETVIGLEVHAQLDTATKIFCGCSTEFGAPPNQNTCPVCLGLPGALPVLNERVVELALRASLALNCSIPSTSVFARKNYFYPDLPKGYQITQYDQPLAINGRLTIHNEQSLQEIRIKRIHMEEDAGKLLHEGVVTDTDDASFVDLNRAGIPLIEIVTEPDLRSSQDAYLYLKELRAILQFCGVSEANMEQGNLRCDANISLRRRGSTEFGTRVEIKNLNSFKNVVRALEYEYQRQTEILRTGGTVDQETRLFDADLNATLSMRTKEEAEDYRYFPDPDLLPLELDAKTIQQIREGLPELPDAKRRRFRDQYQLSKMEAGVLTEDRQMADFFEKTARLSGNSKPSANWIVQSVLERLKESGQTIQDMRITPEHLAGLIELVGKKAISNTQAKDVFLEMWISGKRPEQIVVEKGMEQISDPQNINSFIDQVFEANSELVVRYNEGEVKLHGVLVGLVMKASQGKANPSLVNQLLRERLKKG